jgi:hypothetical protein
MAMFMLKGAKPRRGTIMKTKEYAKPKKSYKIWCEEV